MSTAYETVAHSRPRMRHDVLYTRTEDGVLFHNSNSGFRLTSPTAYRLASLLVPHLNGRNRVADICAPLPDAQRTMIGELIRALYDREFARDIPDDDADPSAVLDPAVAAHFAAQLAYIDHYVGGAPRRFADFRAGAVTVLGDGPIARACAAGLLRNGAASVTVSAGVTAALTADLAELDEAGCSVTVAEMPAGLSEPRWADLDDSGIVVVAGGPDAPRDILRLLAEGIPAGRLLLPAWVAGPRLLIGPLHGPGRHGCWCCAMLRLADNDTTGAAARVWQAAALPPGHAVAGEQPGGPLAAMVGNLLAYEVFRLATGALPAETDAAVLVQHLASLDVLAEPLLTHPSCGFCRPGPAPYDVSSVALDPPREAGQDPTTAAEAAVAQLAAHQPLLQPHLGLLRRYDDEQWDQTPVKAGGVELTAGGRRRTVTAFDVHHVAAARLRALRAAAVAYTGHTAVTEPAPSDLPRHDAARLGLASGWAESGPAAWVQARLLATGRPVAVPRAALEPFGPANTDHAVEPTCAGAGAGADLAEAVRAGLASALSHRALRRLLDGAGEARQIRPQTLGDTPELRFLTKSAANLGVQVELLDLGGGPAPSAATVLARCEDAASGRTLHALATDPDWTVAATATLRDVLGQAQLLRQKPGRDVDTGDPLLVDFDAAAVTPAGDADGRPEARGTWTDVLAELRTAGLDVLVAPVSGPDLARGGLIAVRVLLAAEADR
ncbi:hypothetical protein Cs7R123_46400 [Catellatospora sp. TT07R-123]|uniref:TOMM precursor leader peptide-binding protein n=1 Tax=Catellatospora sp. TT07R-123 TaxID=2733863 RepID=UPI001B2169F2|nr:TOMM precursor leader peptide-binding protein [Catellatospora sp. TT07R-123]GHJ47298.1 hypothetical protein Cs7R123_46400 [Catellatospora sp. TT07R-123]